MFLSTPAGILVHGTNYSSGWNATVDSGPTPVFPVADLVQGVQVPPGQHRVEFRYGPVAFTVVPRLVPWPWQ